MGDCGCFHDECGMEYGDMPLRRYDPVPLNHIQYGKPVSPLFKKKEEKEIIVLIISLLRVLSVFNSPNFWKHAFR